jgi:hypothetical protein
LSRNSSDSVLLVPRPCSLIFIAWQPGHADTEITTPDPNFTPSNAQNDYGKHLASSLPPTLFPILVFAFERKGLRIPIPQLTKALNLGNLIINNLNSEKSIEHEIIALLKCIERYFTHIAKSRDAEISDF